MNTLAVRSPMGNEHPAVSNYRKLKEGAPDTVRSIIIMCNSKFKFMGVAAAKRLFSEDEMNLYELGMGVNGDKTTKTALFLCVPDDDRSFDFIVGMLYTSLFQVLIECARKNGGALPISVEVWMDEFANGSRPESFEKRITTPRSRNIWPNYYNLTLRTMRDFSKTRSMLPEKYEKLSDQELDAVNVKIQCTADEIGIEQKCSEVKLTHTIFLVNERQRWVEDMEELLAVNFYSPVDLNYPNWHHWTGNNDEQREYGVMMAKKLLEEGNCHVVKWNTINEAVDKIGHLADIL